MKEAKLNNGDKIPYIGLGVYRMDNPEADEAAILKALSIGYRHIDTAAYYNNEETVGRAIKKSGIPRDEIFVTTKVWNDDQRADRVEEAIEESLKKLDLDYVDLYLIHWPVADKFVETWSILEKMYKKGKAKAIGVSNFKEHHIDTLLKTATIKPATNQIELHPYLSQRDLVEYCHKKKIVIEAWSPLGANKTGLLDEPILKDLAQKYSKSSAQIVLRWDYQRGIVAIPKSSNPVRQKENISIFDFELDNDEMDKIYSLNRDQRLGADPDNFPF